MGQQSTLSAEGMKWHYFKGKEHFWREHRCGEHRKKSKLKRTGGDGLLAYQETSGDKLMVAVNHCNQCTRSLLSYQSRPGAGLIERQSSADYARVGREVNTATRGRRQMSLIMAAISRAID